MFSVSNEVGVGIILGSEMVLDCVSSVLNVSLPCLFTDGVIVDDDGGAEVNDEDDIGATEADSVVVGVAATTLLKSKVKLSGSGSKSIFF